MQNRGEFPHEELWHHAAFKPWVPLGQNLSFTMCRSVQGQLVLNADRVWGQLMTNIIPMVSNALVPDADTVCLLRTLW